MQLIGWQTTTTQPGFTHKIMQATCQPWPFNTIPTYPSHSQSMPCHGSVHTRDNHCHHNPPQEATTELPDFHPHTPVRSCHLVCTLTFVTDAPVRCIAMGLAWLGTSWHCMTCAYMSPSRSLKKAGILQGFLQMPPGTPVQQRWKTSSSGSLSRSTPHGVPWCVGKLSAFLCTASWLCMSSPENDAHTSFSSHAKRWLGCASGVGRRRHTGHTPQYVHHLRSPGGPMLAATGESCGMPGASAQNHASICLQNHPNSSHNIP